MTLSIATIAATVMIAEQVAGKATRDGFFLSQFPATDLPKAMVVAAFLSVVGSLFHARLLARFSPPRLVPLTFAASGLLFFAEWLLAGPAPRATAVALYLHVAVFGLLLISGFWALVNETFDPHSAKAGISRVLTGATLGGVLGGIIADRVTAALGLRSMLVALGVMHLLCAVLLPRLRATAERPVETTASAALGLNVLRKTPYLQHMAIVIALTSMSAAVLDYLLKARAAAAYTDTDSLVSFFAAFYTATGLATLVVQRTLSQRALRRFGLGAAMSVLPAAVLSMSLAGTMLARLWSIVALRATESVLGNAFLRPGLELLYTPLPAGKRRATKTIVDVACQRLGDLAGGGLVLLAVAFAGHAEPLLLLLVATAAAASLVVVRRLQRGYVDQLGENLRRGVVILDDSEVVDATTRQTLAATRVGVDRDELLAQIRRYRDRQIELGVPGWHPGPDERPVVRLADAARTAESFGWLLSDDRDAIARAVARRPVDPALASLLIPRLADGELGPLARDALAELGPRVVGQLSDAVVEDSLATVVRCHLPGLLESAGGPRARDGLLLALRFAPFEVRYRAAQSLSRLVAESPALEPLDGEVWTLVQSELDVPREEWAAHQTVPIDGTSSFLDDTLRRRVDRGLEHVFTLLSVTLDAELLRLSLRALVSGDPALRGTALEYLENVIPESLRAPLWVRLDNALPGSGRRRSREEVEEELLRTGGALTS
jgi:AAA family ATP:ADP antiporter